MKPELILFYSFAALAVIPAVAILITSKVIYAAYLLLVSLLGVAALYVFAGADFLAVAQIMIYIGGVIVLLIFGIMLTSKTKENNALTVTSKNTTLGLLISLSVFTILVFSFLSNNFSEVNTETTNHKSTLSFVGKNLMTDYAFPFEAVGLLILIALIGAVYVAGRQLAKDSNGK